MNVDALVLTYRREQLATEVVQGLIDKEGFPAERIYLVINGVGGLADKELESSINVIRLGDNLGPTGGYRAGLDYIRENSDGEWIYICEDDVSLFNLPTPRVAETLDRLERYEHRERVGGIVAYGRDLDEATGVTTSHTAASDTGFERLDVAAWGASLVSRRVLEAGVLPDDDWFFGLEDFDFWLQLRRAGFEVVLDVETSKHTAYAQGTERDSAFVGKRPTGSQEPWRGYYGARNFFEFRRRWGHSGWTRSHLVKLVRRMQLAPTWALRRAMMIGLRDGLLRRMGKNTRFERKVGEH